MTSLVRHLHDFIRDAEPTFDEWLAGINFLTRTGHMSTDKRQEFILLSDTLGVSMLVDAINHRNRDGATETTVLGLFYVEGAPKMPLGANVTGGLKGEPLFAEGIVSSPDGQPLLHAAVDVWQSDAAGFYDVQYADRTEAGLRGRLHTNSNGRFYFWSVMPTACPISQRWTGRRHAESDQAPSLPAGTSSFSDRRRRLRNAHHPFVCRGRPISR